MIVDSSKSIMGMEQVLKAQGFDNHTQGSFHLASPEPKNPLRSGYAAISALKAIQWFRDSVRDIGAFKVEGRADFTEEFKD